MEMALSEDLGVGVGRSISSSSSSTNSDLFYDFDPKAESQVTFIDSVINDINAGIILDPNNNNCSMNDSGGGTGGGNHNNNSSLKSFMFDEMLSSPLGGNHHHHNIINSQDLIAREVESYITEEINNANNNMNNLGFSWTEALGTPLTTVSSPQESPDSVYWLTNPAGQVTTLTSLLEDPTFGPMYDDHGPSPPGSDAHDIKLQYFLSDNHNKLPPMSASSPLVSSDLITSTYQAHDGHSPNSHRETVIIAPTSSEPSNTMTVSWPKQSPDSQHHHHPQYVYCHETSTLLRTALQGGNGKPQHIPVQHLSPNGKHLSADGHANAELRRFLSYPPIGQVHSSQSSPTSTSNLSPLGGGGHNHNNNHHQQLPPMNQVQYCEYKILEPIIFSPHPADDADIPTNVEELIMTRIDENNYNNTTSPNRKKSPADTSDRKISSSLSTKWTYTNITVGPGGPGTNKTVKRRSKKQKLSDDRNANANSNNSDHQCIKITNISPVGSIGSGGEGSTSPNSSSSGGGANGLGAAAISRKERSLHHCNICNKGFKDKYSVTVHIRTHTGEKPFACTLCGKSFRQKAHLAKHYQTHAAKAAGQTHGKSGAKRNTNNNNHNNHNNNNSNATTTITTSIPAIVKEKIQEKLY